MLQVLKNTDQLNQTVADWISGYIDEVLRQQDQFTIALSGGSTPKGLYTLLATEKYKSRINWSKLHCFWGDERYVPFENEKNNAKMAYDSLLSKVPVNKTFIHEIKTDLNPEQSAADYEKLLHVYFDEKPHSFDLALLGIGGDAHTLSLFPGYDLIHEKEKWVLSFFLAEQAMYRITLTPPIINRSARVAFLVTGADKAFPLYQVMYGMHDPDLYPAQLIQPFAHEPFWFIDEAAASELSR